MCWGDSLNAMAPIVIVRIADFVRTFFYTFLDISGILLGAFLIGLGWWIVVGHAVSFSVGLIVLLLGIAALIIHTGHYFQLKLASWIFGSGTYFHKDEKES